MDFLTPRFCARNFYSSWTMSGFARVTVEQTCHSCYNETYILEQDAERVKAE